MLARRDKTETGATGRTVAGKTVLACSLLLALAACGGGDDQAPNLMNLRSRGADEFAILPTKPLEMPTEYASLPAPTPGGTNRTDPTPEADAIVALGGNPNAGRGTSADGALLTAASRFGRTEAIRPTLASEDLAWRRDNQGRVLERLFGVNRYYKAYEGTSLDQQAELERWRARGVRTVGAPPPTTN